MLNKATAENAQKFNNNHAQSTAALHVLAASFIIVFMLLIGAGRATAATATFVGSDATTQGNWQGKYGSDGYVLANSTQNIPSYAQLAIEYQMNWTWNNSTSDVRALQLPTGTSRIASAWYQPFSFTMDINLTDGNSHQVAFYAVDWDGGQRVETVQVVDPTTGALLDTRTISNFTNGIYLVWNISGHVQVNVAHTGGSNGVISGAFFSTGSGATTTQGAVATFLRSDVGTQGNWQTAYGSDGYTIATAAQSLPSYANFAVQKQDNWTWAASTSDPRALNTNTGRMASTWYNGSFSFDMNFVDGAAHTVALYALDFDSKGRSESIQIVDANTGASLNNQNISSFTGGMYLVYIIKGHVTVTVTSNSGPNAVISGVFFGTATSAASQPVTTPVTTTASASNSASASTFALTSNATSLSFGTVSVSNSSVQVATLTNSGTGTITISSVVVAGAGFNASGVSAGSVLLPGQSAPLSITFAPASSGNVTGSILITSNASEGANKIALVGSGASQQHLVQLAWTASSSTEIVGYNTYYSTVSGGPYAKLTASPLPTTSYMDTNVTAGETRYYVVTSVDSSNVESAYSQQVIAIVP